LYHPFGLAFDSAGKLFESDGGSGNIFEFTPNGAKSTFASGLFQPEGLAFDNAGNLFVADAGSGTIYEFTPAAVRRTFATGLGQPYGLAFQPVPEPSTLGLLAIEAAFLVRWYRKNQSVLSGMQGLNAD